MSINPDISRSSKPTRDIDYYIEGIRNKNRFILGEAITLMESTLPSKRNMGLDVLHQLGTPIADSIRIGVTGSPGVGKSTFLDTLGSFLTQIGYQVAVLAIDPSSQRSKGSILGDKTRMNKLSQDKNAFVRPTASSSFIGGIAAATKESILLCEHAGYDVIFIETVGVGQSETLVANVVDLFMLLILPGAGDDLQGIKRGIMEMADMIIINKADGERADLAKESKRQYKNAIGLLQNKIDSWNPMITTCSSIENKGIEDIWREVLQFVEISKSSGYFYSSRIEQDLLWFDQKYQSIIVQNYLQHNKNKEKMLDLRDKIQNGKFSPITAIRQVNKEINA